jgi:hypothetical protein
MKKSDKGKDEINKSLKLFNEKADKLMSLGFTKKIFGEKSGFTFSAKKDGPVVFQRYGPESESIDAFVLTYRFLYKIMKRFPFTICPKYTTKVG